ncbi:MAG: response regulator [Tepidisphaeraceae bacterium]
MNRSDTKARILVVDDERNIRLLLTSALQSEGYVVHEAANGAEALERIEAAPFDLMILDLNMPVIDGLGVLQRIECRLTKPRVLVLTAYGSISAAVRATRLGAADFLEKPVTPEELRTAVAGVLNEPAANAVEPSADPLPDYSDVLDRVRVALRATDVPAAESLLIRAADLGQHDAAYFNLIGVIYEIRHRWTLAKKFYGKAMKADRDYVPAQQNMRRIYELYTFGRSGEPVALGDDFQVLSL